MQRDGGRGNRGVPRIERAKRNESVGGHPVPPGCKCYLVKSADDGSSSSPSAKTSEVKQKAGVAALSAGVSGEKEASIKAKAKQVSGFPLTHTGGVL